MKAKDESSHLPLLTEPLARLPSLAEPLARLRQHTPARLGLGRPGAALPTADALTFARDHARARDAVHVALDLDRLAGDLAGAGLPSMRVTSAVRDRGEYLRRPDLGRRLSDESRARLAALPGADDIVVIAADGLSSRAVAENAAPLIASLKSLLDEAGRRLGPVILVSQGRVAIGDEIGEILGARLAIMLVGERPGLSAADSLGAYITFAPRVGCSDAMRNCISNIRSAGLPIADAATDIAALVAAAFRHERTGVALNSAISAAKLIGEA